MQTYTLQFDNERAGDHAPITFDSEDGHEAFGILTRMRTAHKAKIYEGSKLLGTIVKTATDGWLLKR